MAIRRGLSRREEVMLWTGSSYALRRLGRAAEAGQRIHAALEILRELHEYPAAKVQVGGECDGALRALADHYADTGDTAAAIRAYEDLQGKLAASSPQPGVDLRHANSMSRLYRDLGRLYQRAGRRAEAEALRQRRLYLWQYWDHTLPGNVFVQRQLAEARQAG
jgi:tetratricopeptide (TPR) repeat protein